MVGLQACPSAYGALRLAGGAGGEDRLPRGWAKQPRPGDSRRPQVRCPRSGESRPGLRGVLPPGPSVAVGQTHPSPAPPPRPALLRAAPARVTARSLPCGLLPRVAPWGPGPSLPGPPCLRPGLTPPGLGPQLAFTVRVIHECCFSWKVSSRMETVPALRCGRRRACMNFPGMSECLRVVCGPWLLDSSAWMPRTYRALFLTFSFCFPRRTAVA